MVKKIGVVCELGLFRSKFLVPKIYEISKRKGYDIKIYGCGLSTMVAKEELAKSTDYFIVMNEGIKNVLLDRLPYLNQDKIINLEFSNLDVLNYKISELFYWILKQINNKNNKKPKLCHKIEKNLDEILSSG